MLRTSLICSFVGLALVSGCKSKSGDFSVLQVDAATIAQAEAQSAQTKPGYDHRVTGSVHSPKNNTTLNTNKKWDQQNGTVGKTKLKPSNTVTALKEAFKPNAEFYRTVDQIADTRSAQCRRILAAAGINSAVLRSPTVSADLDSDGDLGGGIDYDFVDLKRANLQEELAVARCIKAAHTVKLTQLLVSSRPNAQRSRYLASAHYLKKRRNKFKSIRREISRGLASGAFTISTAGLLRQQLNRVMNQENVQRNQAAQLAAAEHIHQKSFAQLDQKIVTAEQRIHDIEARIRTVDAFSLTGSVSYKQPSDTDDPFSFDNKNDDLSAKLKLSVRLGALSRRRHALEAQLRRARREQYFELDSGRLWQAQQMATATKNALHILRQERVELTRAIKEAKRNANLPTNDFAVDILSAKIKSKIDQIALSAELAGVNATIATTRETNRKLMFKR